jgi:pimeloyl-ACP methyl ester carboxylesterase
VTNRSASEHRQERGAADESAFAGLPEFMMPAQMFSWRGSSSRGGVMEHWHGPRGTALLPLMFMYGGQNNTPSSLLALAEDGVELAEIEHCAHFPMYSNPPQMWVRTADLVSRADADSWQSGPRERRPRRARVGDPRFRSNASRAEL